VLGYPLQGILASTPNLTIGNVSALAGLGDDSREIQITAPVRPGNSGGPVLDNNGRLIGIVRSKLSPKIGTIPENVNFAIKTTVVRNFLDANGFKYQSLAPAERQMSPADVGEMARPFTVAIECTVKKRQEADSPSRSPTTVPMPPSLCQPAHPHRCSRYSKTSASGMGFGFLAAMHGS
jgi:hypothetical protein